MERELPAYQEIKYQTIHSLYTFFATLNTEYWKGIHVAVHEWDTQNFCCYTFISLDILLQRAGYCSIGLLKLRSALSTFEFKGNTFCCAPAEKRADILLSRQWFPV